MKSVRFAVILLPAWLASCASTNEKDTLAELRDVEIEIQEVEIEGGIEKAMESYRRFLEETPETAMTPEAIRRLADLKIEKEYGIAQGKRKADSSQEMDSPERYDAAKANQETAGSAKGATVSNAGAGKAESESIKDFEKRATASQEIKSPSSGFDAPLPEGAGDLHNADALEAIALYQKLLDKYPMYERNDQVLYQMSRTYEELGKTEEAMSVMNRMVKEYPRSRYIDEVQFRRGEYYFARKKYLDAEDAYKVITDMGPGSFYYELGLYKLGWAYYKQDLYEEALHKFIALLDHKVSTGFDFDNIQNKIEKKRIDDTYRVISLSFSNLGGSEAVIDYFDRNGQRSYEDKLYANLGEHYLEKRRFNDAAVTYKAFVKRNRFHKVAPRFDMRVIEIYKEGGFPKLVVDSNKEFATSYGLKSEYWQHHDANAFPEVVGHLKATLKELATHYHALYQDKRFEKEKHENFNEALVWYRQFLESFPKDAESPAINYQLADLLLENKDYGPAAIEYERTAYDYPPHEKASSAGYAAVYAYRENLKAAPTTDSDRIKREVIRSSLKFADTFPNHDKAAIVLGAAVDDLYEMKDYAAAVSAGRKLIANFPNAEQDIRRSAWLVVAHSSFELENYKDAEEGYANVLQLTPIDAKSREGLFDNLAASIYKQGEQAGRLEDYKTAADHFLRIALVAPTSKIRPTAEYDAAAALIQLKDWDRAADVLQAFRRSFPGHELQPEVTKKVAYVYKEAGKLARAAEEYERIETESKDDEVRRGALLLAADLYEQSSEIERALQVYRRYVDYFPSPVELALETRYKIAGIYKSRDDNASYLSELKRIVEIDAQAGSERTDRTRYLAATSAFVITEPLYEQFAGIRLEQPFEQSLERKKASMKAAIDAFGKLVDYEVGEVTSAAGFYLAEIYYHFSRALMESERPGDLNAEELEQYELALEEQSYPFEEKSITVHEKNIELISLGIYNKWIDKSIERLAKLVPARYAKYEESTGFIDTIGLFSYGVVAPSPADPGKIDAAAQPAQSEQAQAAPELPSAEQVTAGQAADRHPAEQVTAEPISAEHTQVGQAPAEQVSVEQATEQVEQAPAQQPSAGQMPMETSPAEQKLAEQPPEEQVPAEQPATELESAGQVTTEQPPAESVPAEQMEQPGYPAQAVQVTDGE